MRHRGQKRRIRFDEEPIGRAHFGGRTRLVGILEGDDATEREISTEVEHALRFFRSAREAMNHGSFRHSLGRQNVGRVVPGVTCVDDEREFESLRERDLFGEHLSLHVARRVVVEVVETAFAHRDN